MIDLDKERRDFEKTQNTTMLFERIEYIAAINAYMPKFEFANQLIVMQVAERFNFGWSMWQARAKVQAVPAQKFFCHDFNGDGFKFHDSLEEAQKEAENNLDYYRERVADGHHVGDEGEFYELCYGIVIASAGYTVDTVVTEDHHKNDEYRKYEVGTEILTLHLDACNSESGAEV
ncbi:hypothetical protein [Acinetobacter baumannii]|uniref:hypothetical protein n=1 Tax=Acinetobacter baumannii TaxID=470 RepID=UPI00209B8AA7|nr:hypothetical protein [Acinetobacter baumannii]